MDKKAMILGKALSNGLPRIRLQKLSGLSKSTFERRLADPDTITIGELRRIDELARFDDKQILQLVREK